MNSENVQQLLESNIPFMSLLMEHNKTLKDLSTSGPTSRFWFIEMMDILFAFQRSMKTGDWESHLEATKSMLPYFFAYDHHNYSRYLSLYWAEIVSLPETHPGIYKEFM